jgi:hypothetical protein
MPRCGSSWSTATDRPVLATSGPPPAPAGTRGRPR